MNTNPILIAHFLRMQFCRHATGASDFPLRSRELSPAFNENFNVCILVSKLKAILTQIYVKI